MIFKGVVTGMLKKLREPVSGLTHLLGSILSIPGLILLIHYALKQGTPWHVVSFSIFGASLILLYTASFLYHTLPLSEKGIRILRKIDHMMIYVLIAGTYTPICLIPLRGPWGWSLFGVVWGIALTGIILTAFWLDAPRWLTTLIYTIMGWVVVIAFIPLSKSVSIAGITWLVIGGVVYSIGALIYGLKWPNFTNKWVGFHEIFHIFVLCGSFAHYWFMFKYVLTI